MLADADLAVKTTMNGVGQGVTRTYLNATHICDVRMHVYTRARHKCVRVRERSGHFPRDISPGHVPLKFPPPGQFPLPYYMT